jgi:hypothetical protein
MTAFQSATLIHQRGLIDKLKHRDSLNVKDSQVGSIMVFWIPACEGITEEAMASWNGITQVTSKSLGVRNKKCCIMNMENAAQGVHESLVERENCSA